MDMSLLKSLIGVMITLSVLFFFAFYFKKANGYYVKNKLMKIKEILNVSAKVKLAIIEVGNESILFSISGQEIKLIKSMPSFEGELKAREKNNA